MIRLRVFRLAFFSLRDPSECFSFVTRQQSCGQVMFYTCFHFMSCCLVPYSFLRVSLQRERGFLWGCFCEGGSLKEGLCEEGLCEGGSLLYGDPPDGSNLSWTKTPIFQYGHLVVAIEASGTRPTGLHSCSMN